MCRKDFQGQRYVRKLHIDWPSANNAHQNESAGLTLLRKILMESVDEDPNVIDEAQSWLDVSQSDPVILLNLIHLTLLI